MDKTKTGIIIGSSLVAAAVAGGVIYARYFTEPDVKIVKVDKKTKEIVFKFSNIKTKLNYENLIQPLVIKGRMDYSIKVVKRGKLLEFQRTHHGTLAGYPVIIEL